jgi:peptidoglycan LD-endopeptidase CwlK
MTTFDARTEAHIKTLRPAAQEKAREFVAACLAAGITLKIISGTRTYEEQNALYEQGRTKPGNIVTKARGGYSWHNFGIAWDIGIFDGGRYLEESPLYAKAGAIGEKLGLEWGGRWKFSDEPHFQLKLGLTLAECRERVAKSRAIV